MNRYFLSRHGSGAAKRLLSALLLVPLLAACTPQLQEPEPSAAETAQIQETQPPTTLPEVPLHSELYIQGVDAENLILWFCEVCLDAEITNSGNPSRLQKWNEPIGYRISGASAPEDLETLGEFSQWVNTVPGFPGLLESEDPDSAPLQIRFCSLEEMVSTLGDWARDCDGGVTFWYEEDRIYSAVLCVRTDLDPELRRSVLLEELYNCLGPVQDTLLREDSIIYSGFSQPQWLTEVDRLILTLLYNPAMEPGMDADQCAQVIRNLYY